MFSLKWWLHTTYINLLNLIIHKQKKTIIMMMIIMSVILLMMYQYCYYCCWLLVFVNDKVLFLFVCLCYFYSVYHCVVDYICKLFRRVFIMVNNVFVFVVFFSIFGVCFSSKSKANNTVTITKLNTIVGEFQIQLHKSK